MINGTCPAAANYCGKLVNRDTGQEAYLCVETAFEHDGFDVDEIKEKGFQCVRKNKDGTNIEYCLCTTDYCNSSPTLQALQGKKRMKVFKFLHSNTRNVGIAARASVSLDRLCFPK